MAGVYQGDYLTSADQAITDWFDSTFGRAKTVIKSRFGEVRLSQETLFGAGCLVFNNRYATQGCPFIS